MENAIQHDMQDDLTRQLIEAGMLAAPREPVLEESVNELDENEILAIEGLETAGSSELEMPEEIAVEAIDEAPGELIEASETPGELIEAIAGEIATEEMKAEAYAEQESVVHVEEVSETPAATPRARAPRTTPAVPRTPRFTGTAGEFVGSKLGVELQATIDSLAKKVKEKAVNLTEHLTAGKSLSVYTQVAVDMLKSEGALDTKSLVARLQIVSKKNGGAGYSIGTARSQAGQQTALLKGFGIVKQDGAKLVPNPKSDFWAKLSGMPAAA